MSETDPDSVLRRAAPEMRNVYSTPLCKCQWPDSDALNEELRRIILKEMERDPGVVKTNRRGWQSRADFQDWPDEAVRIFLGRIKALVREMVRKTMKDPLPQHLDDWEIIAWANVNQQGAFNTAHNHEGHRSIWSGFYYVDPGLQGPGTAISGRTKFQDRSGTPKEILRNADPFEREETIIPNPGLMLMFPSPLYHYVERYDGTRLRITIAFNLRHKGFTIPRYDQAEPEGFWWKNFRGFAVLGHKIPEKMRAALEFGRMMGGGKSPLAKGIPFRQRVSAAWARATAEASVRRKGTDPRY